MGFVLDSSVSATWAFDDEDHPIADEALALIRRNSAVVPSLWWFEIRNTLLVNERRGRLSEQDITGFLDMLAYLSISTNSAPDETRLFRMVRQHRLTVYDAAYLELASRLSCPLATLDKALARAAAAEGVALIGA